MRLSAAFRMSAQTVPLRRSIWKERELSPGTEVYESREEEVRIGTEE